MRFSQDFIEKVRDANNLVDLVSRYTQLNRAGGRFTGLCPFPDHREKTPSFSVNDTQQLYYCFGCKKGGNIFKFVESMMGMNFPESVEWLARQAGIPVPQEMYQRSEKVVAHEKERKLMADINEFAAKVFESELSRSAESSPVREYLRRRGLTAEIIKTFRLGYAPNEWEKLSQLLKARKAPLAVAEKLGLVRERSQGRSGFYDLFRERLMFPIFAIDGRCIGFGGRVIGDGEPKYLNSPESALFHKGQILYGLSETAKFIRAEDSVIVVEGYMDLLALYQAGIKNVVAP
ncbi:MAG: DNA primase, partial [Bdellovibrionales bacterium]|nr:DNA primase [Bdellovibrionales bacterium]